MPKLRLNRIYADILTRNRDSSNQQLAAQLQEAKWLIRNVQQRFETILRVAQAIVERQRRFFEHGEVAMRPMVLREIADMLGLHESTISRVTTQKYMLTPRGTYELKYFFGSHVATDTGGAASATAIRALIKQLIGAEDPKTPLTDSRIADLLGEQGILVARRTDRQIPGGAADSSRQPAQGALTSARPARAHRGGDSMNLNLTGHHLDITPAIRDYVVAKLDRVTRHFDHVIDVNVVLSVDKLQHKVEVNLHTRGKDIHVEAIEPDMYAAIDALVDKLDRQVAEAQGEARAAPPRGRRDQARRRRRRRDVAPAAVARAPARRWRPSIPPASTAYDRAGAIRRPSVTPVARTRIVCGCATSAASRTSPLR